MTSPIRTAVEAQQAMYTQYCITMRALTITDPAAAQVLSDYIRLLREESAARRVAARERRERDTGETMTDPTPPLHPPFPDFGRPRQGRSDTGGNSDFRFLGVADV